MLCLWESAKDIITAQQVTGNYPLGH